MPPDGTSIAAAVLAGVAAPTVISVITRYKPGSFTGYQHAQEGIEYINRTTKILAPGVGSDCIPPNERKALLEAQDRLLKIREQLEPSTDSYVGTLLHYFDARDFNQGAKALFNKTEITSHRALCQAGISVANAEIEIADRTQGGRQGQAKNLDIEPTPENQQQTDSVPVGHVSVDMGENQGTVNEGAALHECPTQIHSGQQVNNDREGQTERLRIQ